jgi:Domain of unknown function (DUF397)
MRDEKATGVWRKSSTSESTGCVEIRMDVDSVDIRNSREPQGPVLSFTRYEWRVFLEGAGRGEFDMAPD